MTISKTDDDSFTNINNDDHRRLSLIDISSADDSLIANPFHHNHSSGKFFTPNSKDEFHDAATKINEWERESRPNEIQNNKINMRQSLAWDTAFFTSPGVLDPEELSSMIGSVEKADKRASSLPAIQEDVHGSCESISTSRSNDSLTQESLEDVDLFQDVRASIQNFGRMSDLARANRNVPSRFQAGGSLTAVGMASCKSPSSKSPSAGMQGTQKLPKKNPITPHLSRKPVARREEPCISKQPKTLGNSSPSSTISSNRSSLGDLHVKSEKDGANKNNCGKVNSVMNTTTTVIKGSQVNKLKPITSSKSPLGPSVATKTKSSISPSSSSNLSHNISKSKLISLKRTKKSPSSCSVIRTPPRIASRDKIGSSNSSLSGLVSATKFSPCISPAKSTSDWSSESSSSSSMTKFRFNSSSTTFHSISNRKHLPENGAQHISNSKISPSSSSMEGKETRDARSIGQCVRTAAAGMVLTPSPKKPLGLRQPSPKIGFFEGVKSSVRTPHKEMKLQTIMPQGRVSPSEGQNKAKLGKLQSPRSIIPTKNKEFVNQQALHPVPLNQSSDVKTFMALPHAKSSAVAPVDVPQPSPKIGFFEGVKSSVRCPRGGMQPRTIAPQGRVSPFEDQNKAKLGKLQSPRSIISTKNKEFVNQQSLHPVPLNKSSDVETSMALPHVESSAVAPMDVRNQMYLKAGVGNLDANSTIVEGHIRREHDPSLGFTQGNSQYDDDQVDCLSRQVELMDINLKTQT
ncbi:ankyrin repeat domain-containing protein 17-like [Trifolium pratense]|uniref:ankyrin repeat domain-containing protein 17-like n=1 Tax=Trifolium pratense TaxID=57577 RepID=UPI001E694FAB|nr:ankyrin repeat domain-containing protein 17-like [Trifolium pratense]